MIKFNPNSPAQMSCILFGGIIKEEVVVPVCNEFGEPVISKSGVNKGGIKTKKVKRDRHIKGCGIEPLPEWKSATGYSTAKEVIQFLLVSETGEHKELIEILAAIRTKGKQISTYYSTTLECLYIEDGLVHATFQTCSTGTGRSSCTDPNIQNQPENDKIVKEHFISRYADGVIMESDWKGLEPRIEAQLSGDPEKINDVLNGIDDHTKNLALKEHMPYDKVATLLVTDKEWVKKRKAVKGLTFVWQYGGGDKKASKASGLPLEEVKALKQSRIDTYPVLYKYYSILSASVEKNAGYKDPWGIRYKFKKYLKENKHAWNVAKRESMQYSYNQVINYRTQGFATGTIVLSMVGVFWRQKAIRNRDKYLMVNTVHDSLVLDVQQEFIEIAKQDLKILETAPIISEKEFGYAFKVPLPVDIKYGKTWAECE